VGAWILYSRPATLAGTGLWDPYPPHPA